MASARSYVIKANIKVENTQVIIQASLNRTEESSGVVYVQKEMQLDSGVLRKIVWRQLTIILANEEEEIRRKTIKDVISIFENINNVNALSNQRKDFYLFWIVAIREIKEIWEKILFSVRGCRNC